jgi:RNA 2',3'-cyclic 3'-phosphodiesterase
VMRLFVAVFPPPEALSHLASAVSTVDMRWSEPSRWHLTLAFLGEVPDADAAAAGLTEAQLNPVGDLAIRGGGRFGSILWAGVDGDVEGLAKLTRSIRRSMRAKRVLPDDKRFRPHVTLARRVPAQLLTVALPVLRDYEGPSWHAREVVLVRSELGAHPSYHPVLTVEIPR